MHGVTISELIQKMKLRNTTPDIDTDKIVLTHPETVLPCSSPGFSTILTGNGFRSSDTLSRHILIPWTRNASA